jgi:tetratricopeptide (TPR) repeat protein
MTLYQVLLREPELAYGSFGTETTGHSEAIPWFRVAVRNEVNPGEAYLALGTSYEALGRMEDALGADILAAEFRPEMSDTHYRLGLAAVRAGARQRARSANEALREVNSELAEDLLSRIEGR